jgi:hypothetical protein
MRFIGNSWFIVLFLLVSRCIEPLDVAKIQAQQKLVVDGFMTNNNEPYFVRLSYSGSIDNPIDSLPPVTMASVTITNDLNDTVVLSEVSPGLYKTNEKEFKGEIGRAYTLHIVTSNNRQYSSSPQKLLPSGVLDSVYFEFEKDAIQFQGSGSRIDKFDALNIYVNVKGDHADFLRWRWKGIYQARTFPELKTIIDSRGNIVLRPYRCSGYISNNGALEKVGECSCCYCWPFDINASVMIEDSHLSKGEQIVKKFIGRIPIAGLRFQDKYYLTIQQYSLTDESFRFWNLVKKQQEVSGNLFQPNTVKVRGNIFTVGSDDEEVMGTFMVSAVSEKSFFVDPETIPYKVRENILTEPCVSFFATALKEKPLWW